MAKSALRLLEELEDLKSEYGSGQGPAKQALLVGLERRNLPTADAVHRLHEVLCFLRAYPDDAELLDTVERMLAGFEHRGDLRRQRAGLVDTGIAGTKIHYRFFDSTARWLVRRWPDRLTVDWADFENRDRLESMLHLLALYCETPGLDEEALGLRAWVDRLKGPEETDAAFLIKRLAALRMGPFERQTIQDDLDIPICLTPGPGTPARTHAFTPTRPERIHFQSTPLDRRRPDVRCIVEERPRSVRAVSRSEGQALIDLARDSMVTRSRDLDVFAYGDPRDVRLVDWGGGLQFAVIGFVPERRLMFEAVYGFLTIKNGVPIGYVLNSALFGSAEIAYNVFETYRGAEAGPVYGRVLSTVRLLFGSDAFTIYPYQLGQDNDEALESGAWWFYQKLGFRARDPDVLKLMRAELARMRKDRRHRSSVETLRTLADVNVYYYLDRPREDVIGLLPFGALGLRITDYLAGRFGSDRERGARACAREAAERFGLRSLSSWSPEERMAWERWSPLLLMLPSARRWSAANRRALVSVVKAKGGRRESDFVTRFDRHLPLRRAILKLAQAP